jgi:HK97 family phage major capsid protein
VSAPAFTIPPGAVELGKELHGLRTELSKMFSEAKTDEGYDMDAEAIGKAAAMEEDIAEKQSAYDKLVETAGREADNAAKLAQLDAVRRPLAGPAAGFDPGGRKEVRDLAAVFETKADALAPIANGGRGAVQFQLDEQERKALEFKATVTSSNIDPAEQRLAGIVESAQFLSDVTDLFAPGTATSDTIEYLEETTYTNAAAETAENTNAPEASWATTLRTDALQELPVFIPVTRRALADTAQLQSFIEGRLIHMVNQRRSQQLISGDGVSPNIEGVLNATGLQTQAKGADPVFDAMHKAITLVSVTGDATPSAIVMHPNDWQDLRLTRTTDGLYILGNPGEAVTQPRLWGLPVRVTTSISENTGLVGAFRTYGQVWRKMGLTIEVSTEHSDYFIKRLVAIMALERLALAVYRGAAFCQVTSI